MRFVDSVPHNQARKGRSKPDALESGVAELKPKTTTVIIKIAS